MQLGTITHFFNYSFKFKTSLKKIMSGYNHNGLKVRQMFDRDSCTYTYLLACTKTNQAILIDPVDILIERDLTCAKNLGVQLVYGVNTHVHADHITGTGLLKQHVPGLKSVLSKVSGGKADIYVEHKGTIKFGEQELECRNTPGHTNGCMTYVAHSHKMAFTGDALLIGGCGRTDFQEGCPKTLFKSIHEQIFSLPNDYMVLPAHDYKGRTMSTVGEEKEFNPRLTKSENDFIHIMNTLGLAYPKHIDRALPANRKCGITE